MLDQQRLLGAGPHARRCRSGRILAVCGLRADEAALTRDAWHNFSAEILLLRYFRPTML